MRSRQIAACKKYLCKAGSKLAISCETNSHSDLITTGDHSWHCCSFFSLPPLPPSILHSILRMYLPSLSIFLEASSKLPVCLSLLWYKLALSSDHWWITAGTAAHFSLSHPSLPLYCLTRSCIPSLFLPYSSYLFGCDLHAKVIGEWASQICWLDAPCSTQSETGVRYNVIKTCSKSRGQHYSCNAKPNLALVHRVCNQW